MVNERYIDQTLATENRVLRNLKITQTYYDLSQGMTGLLGAENVNWCAFATYASKTAGYSIRHEILPPNLEQVLRRFDRYEAATRLLTGHLKRPSTGLTVHSDDFLSYILIQVSEFVSQGNFLVFSDLAHPFARFIWAFEGDKRPDLAKFEQFLAGFRPGSLQQHGQDLLIQSFSNYYSAMFERDRKAKAEKILLANLLIGVHEQTRLQEAIENALDVPVQRLVERRLDRWRKNWVVLNSAHHAVFRHMVRLLKRLFEEQATQAFLVMRLPYGDKWLGQDVATNESFPAALAEVHHPELLSVLRTWDRSWNSIRGSAARNWASLSDRMNYVVDYFRSAQQNPAMYTPPFLLPQLDEIRLGVVPAGRL